MIINLDVSSLTEIKRITKMEIAGTIDQEGLKEFVKAHCNVYLNSYRLMMHLFSICRYSGI